MGTEQSNQRRLLGLVATGTERNLSTTRKTLGFEKFDLVKILFHKVHHLHLASHLCIIDFPMLA
jgi:hypothetical protein